MDKKTGETLAEMREAFLTDAENLWNLHQQRFEPLLEASLKRKLGLSFKATIDMTTSTARLDTEIAYGGEKFKEKVSKTFDDPDQEPLPFDGRRPGTGLPEANGDGLNSDGLRLNGNGHHAVQNGEQGEREKKKAKPQKGKAKSNAKAARG